MEPNLGVKAGWSSHHYFLTSDPPLILLGKSKISHLKKKKQYEYHLQRF